jgi:hypothetical protein
VGSAERWIRPGITLRAWRPRSDEDCRGDRLARNVGASPHLGPGLDRR